MSPRGGCGVQPCAGPRLDSSRFCCFTISPAVPMAETFGLLSAEEVGGGNRWLVDDFINLLFQAERSVGFYP